MNVTLAGVTTEVFYDNSVLLVAPDGTTNTMLASCTGEGASGATLTFDDEAAADLPDNSMSSGSFRPSNRTPNCAGIGGYVNDLPAPAPLTSATVGLSNFDGLDAAGDWKLYIVDRIGGYGTAITDWSLDISITPNVQAVDDRYATDEDTPSSVDAPGVLGNDTDADNDALTAEPVTDPAHGILVLNADGSFTYTPDADYVGPDSFTYRATDGTNSSAPATVNLTVMIPAPVVTSISPANGSVEGGTAVTITGTDFTDVTGVVFGVTRPAISFEVDSPTQITAISPQAASRVTRHVLVTTPSGTSAPSPADVFTYTATVPTVTDVTPTSGPTTGGTPVEITGTGFTAATTVKFGTAGPATEVTFVSSTQVTAVSPATATSGIVHIRVTTSGGTSAAVTADRFSYLGPPPTVTGIACSSGSTRGGDTVVITGTGFSGATKVLFGTAGPATSFTVSSDTQITAVSPPSATTGLRYLRVTARGTTSTPVPQGRFNYLEVPA